MAIEIQNKQIKVETIEDKSRAKSFSSWIQSEINLARRNKSRITKLELPFILQGILDKYKEFEKQGVGYVKIDSWKGKSGIVKLIKKPNIIIAHKYQKPAKGDEPQLVKYKITKGELNAVITSLNYLQKSEKADEYETSDIAKYYCKILGLTNNKKGFPLFLKGEFLWDNFFSWRSQHNRFTIILNILDSEKMIVYKGGKSKIINNSISIQTILPKATLLR